MQGGITAESAISVQFQPSRVFGMANVTRVFVWPEQLQLLVSGRSTYFSFSEMQRPMSQSPFWRLASGLGWRRPTVIGERSWICAPAERHFTFFTTPRVKIHMPATEANVAYGRSTFSRIHDLLRLSGYQTLNLDSSG